VSIPDSMTDDYVAIYTPRVEIDPERTCLVIVDLQYATGTRTTGLGALLARQGRLHEADYRYSRIEQLVVPNTLRLLEAFRERQLRRVFLTYGSEVEDCSDLSSQMFDLCRATRNWTGQREHEILDELTPQPTERVFNKITPSAFNSTPLELVLHTYGVDTLLFTGVSTNMCVEGTFRDAADRGFHCLLVEDACGADSQEMHDTTVTVLQRLYGAVVSTEDALSKLGAGATSAVGA
jgi:nicotinamidase-related amidase